ncbi:hypothetical protein KUF54_09280 [Comamonas sp. Y33R10-2]|uniref:hypothetical protein n=1 Tax=Comamonas sp. Y33R10-2 TaxID=2853257 RepID=UPI001C5C9E12|nr:hypothetical protein [Comamonas sp. Y33R10-2]QXZ08309.1 hypothetical protein KUF54_09280 [Comamonas sp. Y33R10-2]
MSRILMTAAASALACAALLAGCDQSKAPAASAPVGASVPAPTPVRAAATATPEQAPEATVQLVPNPAIEQVRVLHVAKDGEEALASLKSMEGKYRWDGVDYLKTGVLAERLKALTGKHYETLLRNLETVGPLETQDNMLTVFGNRQRMGGEEAAGVVIDPARNGLRIWLLTDGKQIVFTDVDGADIQWPKDMQALIANQLPEG